MKQFKHWYNLAIWQRLRRNQLLIQPLCQISLALGEVIAAEVADHTRPHKGNWELFTNPNNLQSVTKHHHDTTCQQMEAGTWTPPIGVDGWPIENEYLNKLAEIKRPHKLSK